MSSRQREKFPVYRDFSNERPQKRTFSAQGQPRGYHTNRNSIRGGFGSAAHSSWADRGGLDSRKSTGSAQLSYSGPVWLTEDEADRRGSISQPAASLDVASSLFEKARNRIAAELQDQLPLADADKLIKMAISTVLDVSKSAIGPDNSLIEDNSAHHEEREGGYLDEEYSPRGTGRSHLSDLISPPRRNSLSNRDSLEDNSFLSPSLERAASAEVLADSDRDVLISAARERRKAAERDNAEVLKIKKKYTEIESRLLLSAGIRKEELKFRKRYSGGSGKRGRERHVDERVRKELNKLVAAKRADIHGQKLMASARKRREVKAAAERQAQVDAKKQLQAKECARQEAIARAREKRLAATFTNRNRLYSSNWDDGIELHNRGNVAERDLNDDNMRWSNDQQMAFARRPAEIVQEEARRAAVRELEARRAIENPWSVAIGPTERIIKTEITASFKDNRREAVEPFELELKQHYSPKGNGESVSNTRTENKVRSLAVIPIAESNASALRVVFDMRSVTSANHNYAHKIATGLSVLRRQNRSAKLPLELYLLNLPMGCDIDRHLMRYDMEKWVSAQSPYDLLEHFSRDELVIISPHAKTVLVALDCSKVYVVNADYKADRGAGRISLEVAESLNISTVRLPIFDLCAPSCSVDTTVIPPAMVALILLQYMETNNWKKAICLDYPGVRYQPGQ